MNKLGDLSELDLPDMGYVASYHDGHRYVPNAIDAFSK